MACAARVAEDLHSLNIVIRRAPLALIDQQRTIELHGSGAAFSPPPAPPPSRPVSGGVAASERAREISFCDLLASVVCVPSCRLVSDDARMERAANFTAYYGGPAIHNNGLIAVLTNTGDSLR